MPNLHPLVVHFPIVLLTASFALDLGGVLLGNTHAKKSGWWFFLAGSAGLVATVITGLIAKSAVLVPEGALSVLDTHQELALASLSVFAILLFWRIGNRSEIPQQRRALFLSVYALGVLLTWLGALQGGELVYHYGVGVRALLP
jgi:uncharacterized membrane protein